MADAGTNTESFEPPPGSDEPGEDGDWLAGAVDRLARGTRDSLDGLLISVGDAKSLTQTRATCRTHFVVKDANGWPRVKDLATRLADHALDYCIPRSRLAEAHDVLNATGSTAPLAHLLREARGLFTRLERSGEGGELLLYLLLESLLGIPQILCKMPLKTDSQMHVHGTDGVHAKFIEPGVLAVYWGESKVYKSVAEAIDDCIDGVSAFLLDDGGGAADRDILLARDNLDAGAVEVTEALIKYFSDDRPERARLEFRGACLIAFDYEDYPHPYEEIGAAVRAEVLEAMERWYSRIQARIATRRLQEFTMEVFCVPVPSAEDFRLRVRTALGLP